MIKNLARVEYVAPAEGMFAVVQARAHYDHVLPGGLGVMQDRPQIMQIARIAHRHQDIARPHAHRTAAQFLIPVYPELVELFRFSMALLDHVPLRQRKDREKERTENHSCHGRFRLCEQVHYGRQEQHHENRRQSQRDLGLANMQVARHLPLAMAGLGKAQHQHRQRLHGEAPYDAESVERRQAVHVAAAHDDGQQLHPHDQVDDPVGRAVLMVRLQEPIREHAVFGYAVHYPICAHDRGVLCACQDQHSDQYHKSMKH